MQTADWAFGNGGERRRGLFVIVTVFLFWLGQIFLYQPDANCSQADDQPEQSRGMGKNDVEQVMIQKAPSHCSSDGETCPQHDRLERRILGAAHDSGEGAHEKAA